MENFYFSPHYMQNQDSQQPPQSNQNSAQKPQSYDTKFRGLQNEAGINNCFLNVVIQSLWHLYSFRLNFLSFKDHRHSDKEIYLRVRRAEIIQSRKRSNSMSVNNLQNDNSDNNGQQNNDNEDFQLAIMNSMKEDGKNSPKIANQNKKQVLEFGPSEETKDVKDDSLIRQSFSQLLTKDEVEQLQKEIRGKINKDIIKSVQQSEVCLFCNLQDLFTKYEYQTGKVLEPKKVRQSLEQIFSDQNQDFSLGQMGCAQETLEDILNYLHREYLFPNYIEQYLLMDKDSKFKLDNDLDDTGCAPKCPSHQTFGLEFCEITSCAQCKIVDDVSQLRRQLIHQVYVKELLQTIVEYKIQNEFTKALKKIIIGESNFHLQYKEPSICQKCNIPQKIQSKWLLEMPNIYTFNMVYDPTDTQDTIKSQIESLFKIMPYKMDLQDFLKVGEKRDQNTNYILRGMITYYGKHYISYFYSQKHDTWVQFNDQQLKSIGNFKEVMKKCISGRQQPTTLFYEHEEVIINVLDQGVEEREANMNKKRDKRYYFTDKAIKKNNLIRVQYLNYFLQNRIQQQQLLIFQFLDIQCCGEQQLLFILMKICIKLVCI